MEGAVTQLRARLSPVGGGRVPSAEEVSAALSVILDRRPELSASYVCDGISHPVRCLPARPLAARAALGVMDLRGEPPEAAEKRARGVLKAQLEALALPERPGKIAVDFLELPGGEADLMLSAHLGAADRGRALAILASLASGDPSVEAAAEAAAVAGAAAQAPASAGDPGATGYAGAEALAAALSGEPAVPLAARAEMDGAWEEILALASEPTALPRRVARAADKERGERRTVPVRFKAGERDALAAAAGREGAGLAGLLAAAWLAFVARLTGNPAPQCAFLGGPPAGAGRAGAFMRPFPLAAAPGGALGGLARDAEALAARTRALGHLSYPEILRLSPWGGRSTDHALAPPPPAPPGGLPPCVRSLSETPPAALASFPLTLFWKDACGLELSLGYSLAAFEPWQAEVMAQGYEIFLRAAAEDPSLTVSEVEILPAEKRHALLSAAAPAAPLPPGTLPERVAADAARDPVAPAVRQGGLTLTYGELASSSSSLAARLRGKGADFADRALVLASRTVGYPAALLGVMRSGSAAAPVSDALPPAELAALAAALEPRWALAPEGADPAILRAIREAAPRAEILGYDGVPRGEAGAAADPAGGGGGQAAAPPPPDPLGVALVLSLPPAPGEEGAGPRLVPVTHLGLANAALSWGMLVQAGPEDVFSALHDPSQPAGLLEILTPLSLAAAAELAPAAPPAGGAGFFDPDAAAAFVRERGVTVLALPEAAALAYLAGHPLSGLKALCALGDRSLGGANLPPETVRGLMAGAGECRVIYAWGPGEALGLALCEPAHPGRLPGSLGGPVYNTPVYVLDREGRLVPSGYPGRLAVGGPQAAASLLPGGRESALSFAQAPGPGPGAPSSARLFLSRAVGRRRPDGRFDLLGIAGPAGGTAAGTAAESLRQVERALLEAGGVLDARAAAAGRQILAWVVPRPPREGAEAAELERSLKRALTAWLPASLVPARVTAVKAFTHDRWGRVALPASPAAGGGAAPAPPAPGGKSGDPPPHAGAPARPGPDGGPPRYDPRRYGDGTGAGRPSARPPRTGPRR
jgi:non-ribosomal peptide synthetase component F